MDGFDPRTSFGYEESRRYDATDTRGDASGKGPLKTWGAGAEPGATAKVSMLKRPMNVRLAWPERLLSSGQRSGSVTGCS
jgi:hypothetical protein